MSRRRNVVMSALGHNLLWKSGEKGQRRRRQQQQQQMTARHVGSGDLWESFIEAIKSRMRNGNGGRKEEQRRKKGRKSWVAAGLTFTVRTFVLGLIPEEVI
jgi:hypothetical protein